MTPPYQYETKDSGQREEYDSGMRRDLQDGKPRFDLITPKGQPYEDQLLTRWAALMQRGADKYGERNWEKANSTEELKRFKASAFRHFMQWLCGETDEDHAAAVLFNINAAEYLKQKIELLEEESIKVEGADYPFDVSSTEPIILSEYISDLEEQCEELGIELIDDIGDMIEYEINTRFGCPCHQLDEECEHCDEPDYLD